VLHKLEGLYAITDEQLTPDETVLAQVEEALEHGVGIIQYRNKSASDDAVESICRQLQYLCHQYDALFIIDDRAALANKLGADGLHIGKDDMSLAEARRLFPHGIIGVSCYGSLRKAKAAEAEGADYVAFGSFYPSPTKPHSGVVSLEVLERAKAELSIPVCAIGGINVTNVHLVAAKKPNMISVVSAIFEGNIKQNIMQLQQGIAVA
jgi:thiamine-phosphate pyrophosphorylase